MATDRLVYKTALSLVTIATSGLIRLVFSLLIGHIFDAAMLGRANVIVSAAVFATLLCSPGLGQSVARQLATRGLSAADHDGRELLIRATVLHHCVLLLVATAVALLVPAQVGLEQVLALALAFAYGCYTYYKAVLYGVDLVRRYAILELIWDGLFLATLVTVVLLGARHWVLAPMVIVYGGFSVGAHRVLLPRRAAATAEAVPTSTSPASTSPASTGMTSHVMSDELTDTQPQHVDDRPWWRAVGGYALVTTLGTASSAGFLQLSQIFAMRAGGEHAAGLFAAALSLVTPAYLLPRAISVVLFPAMARAAGRFDVARVRTHLTVGTQVLAAALLPLFAMAGVLAVTVLLVAYGRDYADGASTLVIMVWATWITVASVPAVNALSSDTGRAYLVPAGASVAGFLVGLTLWFTIGASIDMVAWGYLIGSVIQSAVPMIEAARRYRFPSVGLVVRVLTAAVASVSVALACGVAGLGVGIRVGIALLLAAVVACAVAPELRALARMLAARRLA